MYSVHSLPNGIKVVAIPAPGPVCYCGLVINAGTRDELPGEQGLAHFVEHTIFKGTSRRSASHILNRLDEVGGELNAYTNKDETAVHASFLDKYFERAAQLISDMVFDSVFPEREIEKEKDVIVDEITSYLDSPAELVFDEFEDLAFAGTPLGHNILGTPESVQSFHAADALRFCLREHSTDQMAFTVLGNIPEDKVFRVAEKFFGSRSPRLGRQPRQRALSFAKFDVVQQRDTNQAHVVLGAKAPDCMDDDRLLMSVISSLLGGPSMNSRLSVALRERNGIAYNVETNYTSFDDTGLFTVYFGTDPQNVNRSLRIVRRELDKLCQAPLSASQLNRLLRQYVSQLLMSADNGENIMLSAGRAAIVYGQALSLTEMADVVSRSVTADGILRVAQSVLAPDALSSLIFK